MTGIFFVSLPKNTFSLNDFQWVKSNLNRQIQVRTSCVGYSDYGG